MCHTNKAHTLSNIRIIGNYFSNNIHSALQRLFEAALGIEIDNRNFRKKMLSSGFLHPTGEKEQGVAHKPAEYYIFDRQAYRRAVKDKLRMNWV